MSLAPRIERGPAGCARPPIATPPRCSIARPRSRPTRSTSPAGSTATSRRSTPIDGWPPRAAAADDRVQRRLPLVRCRAATGSPRRATRRAPSGAARQRRDRDRAPRRHRRGLRLRLSAGVDEAWCRRSNDILRELRARRARCRTRAAARPADAPRRAASALRASASCTATPTSLAGWRFAHDALEQRQRPPLARPMFARASRIDLFACTHTCLAALRDFSLPAGRLPSSTTARPACRTFPPPPSASSRAFRPPLAAPAALRPAPGRCLHRCPRCALRPARFPPTIPDALAGGSPAHQFYFARIVNGPDYPMARAVA